MIIGDGMLARSFRGADLVEEGVCFFASGVSNSKCESAEEFEREERLLLKSLDAYSGASQFVYFGTCSIYDNSSRAHPYVIHKSRMEQLVLQRSSGLVIRLPQVAGPNANPHTILSWLCASVRAGRPITIWEKATRNIIDVADVVTLSRLVLLSGPERFRVVNVANPKSYPVLEIVRCVETVIGARAVVHTVPEGSAYDIDISAIEPLIACSAIDFSSEYLLRTIRRYYA